MLPIYHQRLWVKDLWNNRDADFFMILVVIIVTIMAKTPDIVFIIFWVLLILVFVIYSMQELVLWQLVLVVQVLHALCLPRCFWQLERIFQIILKVRLTLVIWEEKGWARVFLKFQAFWWPRPRICRAFWILPWNLLKNYNKCHTFFFCLLFTMLLLWLLLDGFRVYFKRFLNNNFPHSALTLYVSVGGGVGVDEDTGGTGLEGAAILTLDGTDSICLYLITTL